MNATSSLSSTLSKFSDTPNGFFEKEKSLILKANKPLQYFS